MALKQLNRAFDEMRARASDVVALAQRIEEAAVERAIAGLARALAVDHLLRDVSALRYAFEAAEAGSLPESLEDLRTLPDALLYWLRTRLDTVRHLERGQVIEVPSSRLNAFEPEDDRPVDDGALVSVTVVAPGWKRGGEILVRPRVRYVRGTL